MDDEIQDWINKLDETRDVLERLAEQLKKRVDTNDNGTIDRIVRCQVALKQISNWLDSKFNKKSKTN